MNEKKRIIYERGWWEKLAPNYDKQNSGYELAYRLSIQKTKRLLNKDSRVLEIACGTGTVSLGLADTVDSIAAVDISPNMISAAKEKAARQSIFNIDFQVGDGYSLPFETGSFDVVLLFNALQVVHKPESMLDEAYRLLAPDGVLVAAADCYKENLTMQVRLFLLITGLLKSIGVLKLITNSFKKNDIKNLLEKAKFKIEEEDVFRELPVYYFVIAKKYV